MLELDVTTILFEIANFLLLTALLYHFLFKPVIRTVRARTVEKERLLDEIKQERHTAAQMRAEVETRLADLEQEVAARLAEARQQAEAERAALLQQTQAEVEHILAEAHVDAYQHRQRVIADFHHDLVEAILDLSGWVIGRVDPPHLHETLIQQLNDHVWNMGHNGLQEVETIRRSLKDRAPIAYVTTAQPLSAAQQNRLADTFTALADHNVKLELQTDPTLKSGLRVRLGDTVMDCSVAGQLVGLRREVGARLEERLAEELPDVEKEQEPRPATVGRVEGGAG